jgi:soluble lytic murein transglycosylase-like protein
MVLMQLMPETAGKLAVHDPFDPQENVAAGAKLLKELLKRYGGNLTLALSAYNAGPAAVDRSMSVPAIPETMNYVEKIMSVYPMETTPGLAAPWEHH